MEVILQRPERSHLADPARAPAKPRRAARRAAGPAPDRSRRRIEDASALGEWQPLGMVAARILDRLRIAS
jgi:hypothetical protein